jgi:hypothetical protein
VEPASDATETIEWVHRILKEERGLEISARPVEATGFQVANIRMAYVFYESGLSINVMYTIDDATKRAVGFKLSDGMEVPTELASRFKFALQKWKLPGIIRGFVLRDQGRALIAAARSGPRAPGIGPVSVASGRRSSDRLDRPVRQPRRLLESPV